MGYWRAGPNGESLVLEETGLTWGDQPADILDEALLKLIHQFEKDTGRKPTKTEIRSGLEFSLGGLEESLKE